MNTKKQTRIKRARRGRAKVRFTGTPRLTVHRTPQHIYAQVVTYQGLDSKVLVCASTLDEKVKKQLSGPKTEKAKVIGKVIAERALAAGIKNVSFDRSGFKYHGRVKALADAAREAGLIF